MTAELPRCLREDVDVVEAGSTPQETRPITGHTLESIYRILERYCARTGKLAGAAIVKLEKHRG